MARQLLHIFKRQTTLTKPGLLAQAAVFGANLTGLSYFLKHSYFLKYSKEYSERHGDFGPDEPADELNSMLDDIMSKDLKDMASKNTPIALYLNSGLESTHLGTVGSLSGGFVGVPVFYEFKKEEDVKDFLISSVNYDASAHQEKEVADCFLLSDKAKKYGIAREILLVNTLQVYINAFSPFAICFIMAILYKELNESYRIFKKPLYMRCVIYTAFIAIGLNLWRFLYRNVLHYYESEVEAKITQLGVDYIEGGIEYCTKELKRNSLPVEIKGEKLLFFNAIEDLFCKLVPISIPVETRLEYLKKVYMERKK